MGLEFWFSKVMPIPITLISYYLALNFSLDKVFVFIPSDRAFAFSLAMYSLILSIGVYFLEILAKKCIVKIETVYSKDKEPFILKNEVHCNFNMDTARISVRLKMTGAVKKLSKYEIKVALPNQVSAQKVAKYKKIYSLNDERSTVIIPLRNVINADKKYVVDEEFIFDFLVIKKYETVNSHVETSLVGKGYMPAQFKTNNLKLIK